MQKMRRSSSQIALACALIVAGVTTPVWAKPGKSQATSKAAAKAGTAKTSRNGGKQASAAARKDSGKVASNATPAGKNKPAASPRHLAQATRTVAAGKAARNKQAAEALLATHNKKHDKGTSKTPSSQDLRKQILALQGKGRQLSKIQKQQLARLTAQAQQAEKAERQEKLEQARAVRLAAAQKERQRAAHATMAAVARSAATPANNTPAALPASSAALQEDLLALQASSAAPTLTATTTLPANSSTVGTPASTANNFSASVGSATGNAQSASATALPAQAAADQPSMAASQHDPLLALLEAKQAVASPATVAAVAPAGTAAIATPAASTTPPSAPNMGTTPAITPAVAVAPVARKAEQPAPSSIIRVSVPQRSSLGQIQGLSPNRGNFGPDLFSNVAFAMDQRTGQVLVNKNGHFVSPIASITKLMTAVITMDANLPMDEMITITEEDVDRLKGSRSRLAVGTTLSRQELLHLALMSSENRAAHALGRTYPGGLNEAIRAMNRRALMLGMRETQYVEPTGLSSANRSSAHDLALLVKAAYRYPLIRNYTTYPGAEFAVQGQMMRFNNTNRLIHSPDWNIGLQKTGFISEAGRCVVMQSNINGRNVIIVLLDSAGTNRRAQDAEAIRYWVQQGGSPVRDGSSIIAQARATY